MCSDVFAQIGLWGLLLLVLPGVLGLLIWLLGAAADED